MEEYEPITTELREKAETSYGMAHINARLFEELCDNIDAVHKRLEALCNRTNDEWMRLPVDADGVPIHVGDMLYNDSGLADEVEGILPDRILLLRGRTWITVPAAWYHHHHTPTVEDVLTEFVKKMNESMDMYTSDVINIDEWHDYDDQIIAEYAAKLRLAGDAE